MKLITHFSPVAQYLLLDLNIPLSTLFSNTFYLCSSFSVTDHFVNKLFF